MPNSAFKLRLLGLTLLCAAGTSAQTRAADAAQHNTVLPALHWKDSKAVHIELVSDSTVSKDSGWGPGFLSKLKPGVEGINLAASGRSTTSYSTEGRWQQALALKPDFMLYGFGHNDSNTGRPDHYVDPVNFRKNVEAAVDATQAAGIKIILMTNETERRWNSQGKVSNNTGFAIYENTLRDVAKERNVPLLDVEALTTDLFNAVGKQKMDALSQIMPDGSIDKIHVNERGGMFIGVFIAGNAKHLIPELAPYIQ